MSVDPWGPAGDAVPVLEVGGTHVTAGLVDRTSHRVLTARRFALDSDGSAADILGRLVEAARPLGAWPRWGVAVPGPFDYAAGVGSFAGVGKFGALAGVDLRTALSDSLPGHPDVVFLNDADAFGVGEATAGVAVGHQRSVSLTLGTGVGSAFVADGAPVNDGPDVPPEGSAHRVLWHGRGLEEAVSRRAIRRLYEQRTGTLLDVREIAQRARDGDRPAAMVLHESFVVLGRAMAPWVRRFDATVLVLGGSIARSFDVLEGPLREGLATAEPSLDVPIRATVLAETAALVGVATHAHRAAPRAAAT